ncbi:MAG TPA: acyl-CoA dehydrogenase family protein [Actinomycetota bacterium]|nr:acyl-CoA dehydrogenase family protein [Actinomycetota bacterium]
MEAASFSLTPEQEELIADTRRVAREELLPLAEGGQPGMVNRPLVRALGEHGLLPRLFPERVGGTRPGNVSAVELCLLREALAIECTEAETALALQGLGAYPIVQAGSEDLASRYVPPVVRGETIAAFALTEPEHGSDAAAIELRTERDGDGFRLSGVKAFISNAPQADLYTVFARTTAGAGAHGVTAFVVPGDSPGLTGEALRLLVPHAIGRLELDGVRVPGDHVLGGIDEGFGLAMRTLDLFRPSVGAFAVGMARAALNAAVAHAAKREAFGRAISEFQAVSHTIAEMATRTEAARLMVYSAAAAHDEARPGVRRTSAMAKLFATETAQWVVDAAIQVHGAAALADDHLLAKLYREVRAPRIYEGTSEIQREIIARELFR